MIGSGSDARKFAAAAIATCLALAPGRSARAQQTGASASPAPARVAPRIVREVDAEYPPEFIDRGIAAIVRLTVDIDASGHVTDVTVAESSGEPEFDAAAMAAVRGFEFEPARESGQPVAARIRYRYSYTPPVAASSSSPSPSSAPSETPTSSGSPAPSEAPASSAPSGPPQHEQGITVYAHARSREVGRRELTQEEIRRMPGSRGDALLAVMNLPGIARPQFGLGQFIVRSSAPEDTLVTLEGQPISLPFHFQGLASTISTNLIDHVEYLPGNFSARYGRVAGGVINVELRPPARDRIHSVVDLDVIDAGVFASAPLGRNAAVAIGARRSFIDLVAPLFFAGGGGTSFRQWPVFWDAQVQLDWDPTPNDKIRVIATANDDQLRLHFTDPNASDPNVRGDLGTHLAFAGIQTRWQHRFSEGVIHTFAPAFGYNYSAGAIGPEVSFNFVSYVLNLRDELEFRLSRHARVFVGIDSQYGLNINQVHAPPLPTNGIQDPIDPSTIVTYVDHRTFFNPGGYIEAEIDPVDRVRMLAGVRVDRLGLLNATTVNPRSTIRVAVHPRAVLRAGFGLYTTPPRGYYIVEGFGNPDLQPERWLHISAGGNIEVVPGLVDFDTDVFIKSGDNVVTPSAGNRLNAQGLLVPEHFSNAGLGRVIGAEWMLRVRPGLHSPVYGLISYTYQRATRSSCVAGCAWTTYQYDQPHILTIVVGTVLPYGFEAGLRLRFTSGIVTPNVTGSVYDADHDVALSITDPLNPGRLPPYFALDWRVAKHFRLGPIRGEFVLEVLNTTNNNNAESIIYSYDRRTHQYIYGLPIIPSLGIRAEY